MCQSRPVNTAVLVWLLAGALALALAAVVFLSLRVIALDRELDDLRDRTRRPRPPFSGRGVSQAATQAATLMSKVVETAARVREQGVGGMLLSSLEDFSRWAADQRSAIARVAAEDGTVTIFFSDIEGSTTLNSEVGDNRWVRVLEAHDELVETFVEKYRGLIVKKQGDGHMVVFSTPELAVRAALDIQRAFGAKWNHSRELRRTPVKVRIGLHTGTAIERGGDYFGRNVALAARVAAEAAGGQVLVTEEVAGTLGDSFAFSPARTTTLKGFDGEHQLWQVERPG